jgi:DNA-binding CsgD family transcriptional regulator/PAS domain-containing protein
VTFPGQALSLIERIYEAALEPSAWHDFVSNLADAYGAKVVFALQLPGFPLSAAVYHHGFEEGLENEFLRHVVTGLPWDRARTQNFVGRFGLANEVFPDDEVEATSFYRECMRPTGLAPVGPIGHTIALEHGRPLASLAIFRLAGGEPWQKDDLALGDLLVPHLAKAYRIHQRIRETGALAEAMDRLPTGIVLLDAGHRPVLTNRTARFILGQRDGISIDESGLRAGDVGENKLLREFIRDVIPREDANLPRPEERTLAVSRPSGRRAYPVMLAPLLASPSEGTLHDAVAVVYIADVEAGPVEHAQALRDLYGLTQAEIELVVLLCEGCPLDEAAKRRRVTLNTARSQLKQIFAKTGASRQSDLVRLVLSGIAQLGRP